MTLAERGPGPLGQAAGNVAALWQRQHGVDLRCHVTVMALDGGAKGRLRRERLSDGDILDIDVRTLKG